MIRFTVEWPCAYQNCMYAYPALPLRMQCNLLAGSRSTIPTSRSSSSLLPMSAAGPPASIPSLQKQQPSVSPILSCQARCTSCSPTLQGKPCTHAHVKKASKVVRGNVHTVFSDDHFPSTKQWRLYMHTHHNIFLQACASVLQQPIHADRSRTYDLPDIRSMVHIPCDLV